MTDNPDLDAIVARIRKLSEMTPERGCSEAEDLRVRQFPGG